MLPTTTRAVLGAADAGYRRHFADAWAPETARKLAAAGRLVRALDPSFALGAATRVLDVGCGLGRALAMLGALGAGHLVGLDDYGDTHDAAPHVARLERMGATPVVWDLLATPWPLEAASLDLVVCFNTLEHLPHGPRPVLAEVRRVLRPGGIVVLSGPNALALYKRLYVLVGRTNYPRFDAWWHQVPWRGHVREPAPGELRAALERAGFTTVPEIGLDAELPERLGWRYPLYAAAVALAPSRLGEVLLCAGRAPG